MKPNEAKVLELWLRGVDGANRIEPAAGRAFTVVTYVSLCLPFWQYFNLPGIP